MHEAAFRHCGISATYDLFDVTPEDFCRKLEDLGRLGIKGANVTVPHKVTAFRFIKEKGSLDREALKYGAVNTIYFRDGVIRGTNTDGIGFLRSLKEDLKFSQAGKRVFVIGAGGAARAIVIALGDTPEKIIINDIRPDTIEGLIADYRTLYKTGRVEGYAGPDRVERHKIIRETDLLINATGIGMHSGDDHLFEYDRIERSLSVFDVIYNPLETALLRTAKERGCRSVNGLGMLLYQGAEAFRVWTSREPPIEVMREALTGRVKSLQV